MNYDDTKAEDYVSAKTQETLAEFYQVIILDRGTSHSEALNIAMPKLLEFAESRGFNVAPFSAKVSGVVNITHVIDTGANIDGEIVYQSKSSTTI